MSDGRVDDRLTQLLPFFNDAFSQLIVSNLIIVHSFLHDSQILLGNILRNPFDAYFYFLTRI